ncbi:MULTISPECIES: hypothetical protein [Prochlorococcus]|uniref:Uncharacterized protein n=1 Tax=Prochlorococcus marinus (strain SARG / CCMP1375 / SS120) TaxID=167539 RepID=Q7VBH5_PROMA|nr:MULTISPECIES: hypothetical protein [Prochlorococcus]AAQ00162.1 Predicted protein [Prochlorococcus marinus subsp. marinus str. CCMP1375]KGG13960.1 hypothetical protein EV04_0445 [Prochlorococcus marinus str. LG]KGG19093.1 hypothetical protein EV08_1580 [Prochlorococcus marinus str. SS2]KGG23367.1 hypothetical protein EV09_0991 [Prochlorococcus marinus str. SS35]KGG32397.1 hypothetical protein EV10_1512 [Prochlorococcus marinus str. SS51]
MISQFPFFLSIGDGTRPFNYAGSIAISRILGSELVEISSDNNPIETLKEIENKNELIQFIGDAAMLHPSGTSWMEAIGAWGQPVILMVKPTSSGEIPGIAAAYVSLCKSLSVPLVGLVQLGGSWDFVTRKADGLPWCGCIPTEVLEKGFSWEKRRLDTSLVLEEIVSRLKARINFLKYRSS